MNSVESPRSGSATMQQLVDNDPVLHAHVVANINKAIGEGWVKPFYQPVIRAISGKLCGFEALARWDDPTYGLLPPSAFIPVLEEARLIHLLDRSIIRQVCKQMNARRSEGLPVVPISLNLSRLDFELCNIFAIVEHAALEFGIPRRMLNIEITESALGADPEYMATMMRRFHDAGYEVWMDDFGSGYSTLNVLKDFDFDELKIDMAFLSHFNEKSKTVLASVVDMAKKLGIQTLAEGVETEEHFDFLRSIGCEKMQGYLFGKPEPYNPDALFEQIESLGIETASEQGYLNRMGAVNMLSLSERDLTPNGSANSYVSSTPIAIVEYSNDRFHVVESNSAFGDALAHLGISSIEEAERLSSDCNRPFGRQAKNQIEGIKEDRYARFDYAVGNATCVIRARYIASENEKTAFILAFGDTIAQGDQQRHDRMNDLLAAVYSIYDHISIIHLDERFIEPVFDNTGSEVRMVQESFDSFVPHFAESEVYFDDCERYLAFMDRDTMIDRLDNNGEDYLIGFFRLRQHGGNYAWKLFTLFKLGDQPGNQVMLCVRRTHRQSDELLHSTFGKHQEDNDIGSQHPRSCVTDGSLWRAIAHGNHLRLFWKDADRRFIGANRAFLDYYGFASVEEIRGKTDEDMGWHIDPIPFSEDELDVIHDGINIEDVSGHCIVNGEMRSIIASKYPIYRNGHIVGLVGFFFDAEDMTQSDETLTALPMRDDVTGLLSYIGLEAATWKYVDTYKRQGLDFAMISIHVDNFESLNAAFGSKFGDKVLKRIAEEIVRIVGHQRVCGHVFANRFVILAQDTSDEELQGICDEIERSITAIAQVDGTPCTVYAFAGYSRFSKHGDVESMKRDNRDRRLQRRENWIGSSGEEDIITSSII